MNLAGVTPRRIAVVGKQVDVMLGFRGDIMQQLKAHGHTVYAFATDYDDNKREKIESMGFVPIAYKLDDYSINPFKELRTTWQLYRLFKRLRIEVSYCYFAKPAIYGTLAASWANVPNRIAKLEGLGRTFTQHAHKPSLGLRLARFGQCQLFKLALPKAHSMIFLNHDDQADIGALCGARLTNTSVLGGIGVCLEKFSFTPVPTEPLRFVFVGRLLNEKGIRYFLQAAEQVKARYPKVEFRVVGAADADHGISQQELKRYIEQGIVEHTGKVDDVVPYIQSSSVFVLPSYYREGLPRSSQEALAVGRPIITTNTPGCRETIHTEDNGFANGYLVPPHDVQALVDAIEQCISNREQLGAMGHASRALAEQRFDVREVNQRLLHLLNL